MSRYFLDSGYVLPLELSDGQGHKKVSHHWSQLLGGSFPELTTTTFVFDEIVTYFNSRGYHQKALKVGNKFLRSTRVNLIHVDQPLLELGWAYLSRYQDKRYSLTDCISFVVMEQNGIKTALSVDHHFEQAGFRIEP